MCGVFGWIKYSEKEDKKDKIVAEKLFRLSSRRGKDASGICVLGQDVEEFVINSKTAAELMRSSEYKEKINNNLKRSAVIVGHTRLATNGDCKKNELNQPLVNQVIILAHNGIVVNSYLLAKKYKIKESESDSVVLRDILEKKYKKKINFKQALKEILSEVEGTVNMAIYCKTEKKLFLASNNGSLYVAKTEDRIIFASEKYFLEKVAKYFGKFLINKIEPGEGKVIDQAGKVEKFTFKKKKIHEIENLVKFSKTGLENHKINEEKIKKIRRCKKCILPETTPFISFNKNGICNFCTSAKKIENKGIEELKKITEKYKSKDGKVDCILAFSGGRDSSYGLHYLIKKMGMHPVAVTFDWGMLSDTGRRNQAKMLGKLGVENITVAANMAKARKDIKKNLLAWLKKPDLGMIPLLMQGDKTTEYYVDKIRKELGVKLVFFCRGNELEKEEFKAGYCGVKNADPGGVIHNYPVGDKIKLLFYYAKQFILNPAYINKTLWSSLKGYLVTFVIPHNYIYLWHYIPWEEKKIVNCLRKNYGWEGDKENGATWRVDDGSPSFYNYVYYQIQGFTENDSFRSNQIRQGMIKRDEALKLVYKENKPRYQSLKWYFEAIGLNGKMVLKKIDKIKKRY